METPASQTPLPPDEVLLGRIEGRDQAALEELYRRKSGPVYGLALSMLRRTADAEEVTQEVFLRIWNKAHLYDPQRGSPNAWIITMARRLIVDRVRSKSYRAATREQSLDGVDADGRPEFQQDRSSDRVLAPVQGREVREALARLEPPYREVLELAYFEGLSHSAIAARLDAPLGTVKSRLREGVLQLRRVLKTELKP